MSTRDWLDRLGQGKKEPVKPTGAYTEEDLKGIRVAHSIDDLEAGASEILVARDVDVNSGMNEDDDATVLIGSGGAKQVVKKNITFSFDQEEDEEEGEASFVIGSTIIAKQVEEQAIDTERRSQYENLTVFDTLVTAATSGVAGMKRKRNSRKRDFTEEPVFQPRPMEMVQAADEEEEEEEEEEKEKDHLSRTIAATRQKNLELIKQRLLAEDEVVEEEQDDEVMEGGATFLSVPSFMENIRKPERFTVDKTISEQPAVIAEPVLSEELRTVPDRQPLEGFLDEPLVSSSLGVGKALQFLRLHGRPLKLSDGSNAVNTKQHREIRLVRYDDLGNEMTEKEAYKELSHRFHGNKSGKNKEERRMKKAVERRKERVAAITTVGSQPKDGQQKQEKQRHRKERRKERAKTQAPAAPSTGFKIFGMK